MVFRALLLIGLLPYTVWLVRSYDYHLLDNVNLAVHEAGHVLFTPFGQTWHMLGGTLLQLVVPLAFALRFLFKRRRFDAAVCGVWFAESLMYTAVYLGDAYLMALPLVGGEIHDWNWMLSHLGLVRSCTVIATVLHLIASVLAMGCLVAAVWITFADRQSRRAMAGLDPQHAPIGAPVEGIETHYDAPDDWDQR